MTEANPIVLRLHDPVKRIVIPPALSPCSVAVLMTLSRYPPSNDSHHLMSMALAESMVSIDPCSSTKIQRHLVMVQYTMQCGLSKSFPSLSRNGKARRRKNRACRVKGGLDRDTLTLDRLASVDASSLPTGQLAMQSTEMIG